MVELSEDINLLSVWTQYRRVTDISHQLIARYTHSVVR